MQPPQSVSVVINTLNRADALANTLRALRQQTNECFEVVVVVGPCTDKTLEVVEGYGDDLKVLRCPAPNLSMSRNIGIRAAGGDVIAFVDDDGIPEPTWIDDLLALYDDDVVAGAGGVVRDHTGFTFQCRFNAADRWGNSKWDGEIALDDWCTPGGWEFPYLVGTNSSFRRDLLVKVGGFDEEFEFYLDETDVCLRLIDAGYVLRQGTRPEVHHKFLPSDVRNSDRVTLDLFPVVKNKIYFSMVNGRDDRDLAAIFADNARFAESHANGLRDHFTEGRISEAELVRGLDRIEQAWQVGVEAGFRGRVATLPPSESEPPSFVRFPVIRPSGSRLRLCFVTQGLPPDDPGGIGRYMLDTARSMAARGHEVRIITTSETHNTVDLEQGVWIHRIRKDGAQVPSEQFLDVPDRIWRNAGAVADEVERLDSLRPLDVVSGAMWDVETLAVMERTTVPVTTTLVTTMGITLQTKPEWSKDAEFSRDFLTPMLNLEREVIERSTAIHAISEAILEEALRISDATLGPKGATVASLGVADHLGSCDRSPSAEEPEILFVGRLEKRKGIDLLLDAVPELMHSNPTAHVTIIGRDNIPNERGSTYRTEFERAHDAAPWIDRVTFAGPVSDQELWDAYRRCFVFVAPSRFESFGLVYVEAMMAGKAVVAVDAGAAPEVVENGVTGVLVNEDPRSLASAISDLVQHPDRARRMGEAGRQRYEDRFTDRAMGDAAEQFFLGVTEAHRR